MNHIKCPTCSGTGRAPAFATRAPVLEALRETVAVLPKRGKFTASDIQAKLTGVAKTAVNNRLERLRERGILIRERFGRFWLYARK